MATIIGRKGEQGTKYVIIYKHLHKEELYNDPETKESYYPHGKTTVEFKEVDGFEAMQDEVEVIGEMNADNPPYDEYHVVLVYNKDTQVVVPKHWWYRDNDVADIRDDED
jgi:hypothetical protein